MSNIFGSINLAAFKHVEMETKGKSGMVKGIFIPLEANKLEKHEKGGIYFNIAAFQMKEPKEYATHIVKQSLPKEVREKMTDEEKNAEPLFGNLKVSSGEPTPANNDAGEGKVFKPEDNLPF